jgi:glycolate oxidase iron-sulfur subunit
LFSGIDAPSEDDLYKCIHCGFCLQVCPTYLETGLETESPRGRIALMKAVNEGRIGITPTVYRHWDLCIQCRACEPACPSGVPYGRLIEATMAQVERHRRPSLLPRMLAWLLLKQVVPNQRRLSLLASGLRLYQRSGLQLAIRKSGILRLLSRRLASLESASPPPISATYFWANGQVISANGPRRAHVALLSGCIMPLVNGPEMRAVTRVLSRNGCEVVVPQGQVCCGALHSHAGDLEMARDMARRNIDVFLASGVDAVVVASAGCGVRMKEYDDLLRDDAQYHERARMFTAMVKDVHEFLVELPFTPPRGHLGYRLTYQDSCHLAQAQRITEAPRILLRSIPGVQYVEMDNSSPCCGAGGAYSITQREFSLKLLDTKMKAIMDTDAWVVATANPGCYVQLLQGANRGTLPLRVRYVTDLLDESYSAE